ncbi:MULTISPECIES: type II/III secretion system protein [Legionella]|uniref:Type II/III secretion system protein n=1 Tax=Legionella donaldsonii TaxID=45060 RepID=A0A378J260_9GAMM|nr:MULTISPECIES: type II/III secretion system protein [Legionella]MCC5015655.1 type II/III secretion system protein [Legionella sp. 31fI33]STX40997.1 type II/III secretion system protein [Legionella donaldsonii]
MKKWFVGLLFLAMNVWADQMITKVIELNYQNADNVIRLVQPLLQDGEQITGSGQTLVVKVTPQTLTQLRTVLHKLDQPPVTFEITVFQGDPDWLNQQNDNDMVISTSSQSQQRRRQSVTVMNGESAFVSTGEDQPVLSSVGIGFWGTGVSYDRRLVQNGLLVEPVLQGQRVKLTVRRVREQDNQVVNQQFDEQQVNTTVMVPLNQWVPLASAEGDAPADSNTIVIRAGNQYTQNSTLYIKVRIVQKESSGINKE